MEPTRLWNLHPTSAFDQWCTSAYPESARLSCSASSLFATATMDIDAMDIDAFETTIEAKLGAAPILTRPPLLDDAHKLGRVAQIAHFLNSDDATWSCIARSAVPGLFSTRRSCVAKQQFWGDLQRAAENPSALDTLLAAMPRDDTMKLIVAHGAPDGLYAAHALQMSVARPMGDTTQRSLALDMKGFWRCHSRMWQLTSVTALDVYVIPANAAATHTMPWSSLRAMSWLEVLVVGDGAIGGGPGDNGVGVALDGASGLLAAVADCPRLRHLHLEFSRLAPGAAQVRPVDLLMPLQLRMSALPICRCSLTMRSLTIAITHALARS